MNHYLVHSNAPISDDQLLASLRRDVECSLRIQPERLPWRGTEDLESRHDRTSYTASHARVPAERCPIPRELDAQDERVAQVLASGPLLCRELEDELGLSVGAVRRSLGHLQRTGRVIHEGPNNAVRWRLVEDADE